MKLPIPSIHLFLILLFLSTAACVPITPKTGGDIGSSHPGGEVGTPDSGGAIGVLRTSGPNVYLNNSPAADGAPVYLGNSVATGAGSSAKVEFADGGYLQLDENTDPLFEWLEQSKCLLIRIVKGQVYLKKSQTCVEGPDISMILNSEINLIIPPPPAPSELTVIRGSADVTLATRRIKLVKGQQLKAIVHAPEVKTLSPDAVTSLAKWKKDYRFKLTPDRVLPDRVRPVPVTPDRPTPERITPVPVTPDRATPDPTTPDRLSPVKPLPVTPDRGTSVITPDRVTATPDPGTTAKPPVLKRPLRAPRSILPQKSAPVQESVPPDSGLR